jgi:2-phospho-L-lactate guanylyltransferase
MESARIRAVIPMKPLEQCKRRLEPVLDAPRRAQLTLSMLERVVRAAESADALSEVTVLGGDEPVRALCRRLDVAWHADLFGDLNAALQSFYEATSRLGFEGMLYLAGDLPAVHSDELQGLAGAFDGAGLVLGPGARGGTNAILLRRDLPFVFQLGEQSFRRHREQAQSLGLVWTAYETPALHADIDTPSDIAWLEREEPGLWQDLTARESGSPPLPGGRGLG